MWGVLFFIWKELPILCWFLLLFASIIILGGKFAFTIKGSLLFVSFITFEVN